MEKRAQEVEQKLKTLNSESALKEFLAFLGFHPETKSIVLEDEGLKDVEAYQIAVADIGSSLSVPAVLLKTPLPDNHKQDRHLNKIERLVYKELASVYGNGLFISTTKNFGRIHIVNVKTTGEKAKPVFRRFIVGEGEKYRTASERLVLIDLQPGLSVQEAIDQISNAFDVEAVTRKFFDEFWKVFGYTRSLLAKQKKAEPREIHTFTHQLFSRFMFLYFLQRMGWLGEGKRDFMFYLWQTYQGNKNARSNFYGDYLKPLFFGALRKPYTPQKQLPKEINSYYMQAPYLNGGLFTENDLDRLGFDLPDELFENVFGAPEEPGFLERYNFTIHEESPWDVNVAVDPAMLGKVYESLTFRQEERGEAGIFYTPRVEIDFMCKRALLDYLRNNLPKIEERKLYRLVFFEDKERIDVKLTKEEIQPLKEALEDVTVADPAVGSGSFLVGMMEILLTLFEYLDRLEGKERTPMGRYELKKKIIERSLYGVDVMDWAIKVCQLRLWLQLIIDASDKLKTSSEPILPSLSFKLRDGDSLVQEIGHRKFPLKVKETAVISQSFKRRLANLQKLKTDHYQNKVKRGVVEHEEKRFFTDLLRDERHELRKTLKRLKPGVAVEELRLLPVAQEQEKLLVDFTKGDVVTEAKIDNLKAQVGDLDNLLEQIEKEKRLPFVWGIGFAEIFSGEKEGFDIVIGNPPYVRQEKIVDPLRDKPTLEQKQEYKKKLLESIQHYWDSSVKIQAKADLYVYFYLVSLALLNPKGAFCFITSSSWLDVGYGAALQEFLLRNVKIGAIYDNQVKRTFAAADVNTVISSFSAKVPESETFANKARFVMFKKPYEDVIFEENIYSIDHTHSRTKTDDYRLRVYIQEELLRAGWEVPEGEGQTETEVINFRVGNYAGDKWGGKYLRAPDIYWTILEKGGVLTDGKRVQRERERERA